MANLVCEERPSSRRQQMPLGGFVAEVRPRFRPNQPAIDLYLPEETALNSSHFSLEDQDPNESIEKLLSNKSKKEYTDILTSSVIKLVQTLLTGHDIAAIEGSFQVSFHGIELPIQVKLKEIFSFSKKDYFLDVGKDVNIKCQGQRSPSLEMNWDVDQCLYHNQLSPGPSSRDEICSVGSSPPRTEQMITDCDKETDLRQDETDGSCLIERNISPTCHPETAIIEYPDSGEDSCYMSNDTDDSSDYQADESPKVELFDQEKASRDYEYRTKSYPGMKQPLVTDVIKSSEDGESAEKDTDAGKIEGRRDTFNQSPVNENDVTSSSSEDGDCIMRLTRSYDTDSDALMDLSEDCKIAADSKSVSKEYGLEVKTPPIMKSSKCQICFSTFPDTNTLCKHVVLKHQAYMCQHCSRFFTAKNNLKRHIRIHTGLKPYKCSQCSMTFARRDDLKGHILRHDYSKPYRCSICKKGYTDRVCVKNHMVKEHGSRLMVVCPQCGEGFDQEECFSAHKKTHPELIQYACDICPFIGSNNLMACKHSLVHSRKLFSCKPCNAYFADPFGYTDHIRTHKKHANFISYVCCFCDISLPTYEQFIRHEYSHAHCKTHACHICNKQFRSKVALQEHVLNHADFPDCDKKQKHHASGSGKLENASLDEDKFQDIREKDSSKQDGENNAIVDVQEGALDLTLKKPATTPVNNPCVTSEHSFSKGQEKISNFDVPRNGYVSEISCPRKEECTLGCMEDTLPKIVVTGADQKDVVGNFNAILDTKGRQKESPFIERPSNQRNGQCRFNPYPLPSKAAELASKFLQVRGMSPFIRASAKKDVNKSVSSSFEQKELVIEKDSSGKASIHIVTQTASHKNFPSFRNELNDEKENSHDKMLCDTNQKLTQNVFYGLSGKEYRKESPISPILFAGEPSKLLTSIKQEQMEDEDFSMKSSHIDNVRESLSPLASVTANKPEAHRSCDICSQTFDCFSQLESHSVLSHKRFMCEYCNKGFTSRPNRDRHVRYHTGEKPYKCDLCDHAFHRGDDLKYHRTTRHPDATPFVCSRCSATFTWKRDLDRHVRHSKCKF